MMELCIFNLLACVLNTQLVPWKSVRIDFQRAILQSDYQIMVSIEEVKLNPAQHLPMHRSSHELLNHSNGIELAQDNLLLLADIIHYYSISPFPLPLPFPIFPFTLPHFFLVPPYLPQIYEILQIQFVNRI